jgi:predicted acyltransferase
MAEVLLERAPRGRVVSIDALRGFDMFWIIGGDFLIVKLADLVDAPWGEFLRTQVEHTAWHGFTFLDLIFPLFLFIVGLSMTYSMGKRIARGDCKRELYGQVIRRFLTLLLMGYVFNGLLDFQFDQLRHTGVLTRIAYCYLITSVIMLHCGKKAQVWLTASLLLLYWALMTLVPVPGHGAGALTPAGNLAGYIDRLLLPGHWYDYGGGDYLGILSYITATASTLAGVLTGHWMRSGREDRVMVRGLVGAGVAALVVALLWDMVFPINKPLWTSSYVVYAAGWSCLLLAVFYWVIDMKGYKSWAFPFVVIGLNPITIYLAQRLFNFGHIADIFVHGFIGNLGAFEPLFYVACVFAVKWLFVYFLYRQRIFLKA